MDPAERKATFTVLGERLFLRVLTICKENKDDFTYSWNEGYVPETMERPLQQVLQRTHWEREDIEVTVPKHILTDLGKAANLWIAGDESQRVKLKDSEPLKYKYFSKDLDDCGNDRNLFLIKWREEEINKRYKGGETFDLKNQ